MLNLDPAKLLVILVIVLIVVGPERLPRAARQLGSLIHDFSRMREKMLADLKGQIPDLPQMPDLTPRHSLRSLLFDPDHPQKELNGSDAGSSQGNGQAPRAWSGSPGTSGSVSSLPSGDANDPSMN